MSDRDKIALQTRSAIVATFKLVQRLHVLGRKQSALGSKDRHDALIAASRKVEEAYQLLRPLVKGLTYDKT